MKNLNFFFAFSTQRSSTKKKKETQESLGKTTTDDKRERETERGERAFIHLYLSTSIQCASSIHLYINTKLRNTEIENVKNLNFFCVFNSGIKKETQESLGQTHKRERESFEE